MKQGDKVICINDTFPEGIEKFYSALPKKGNVYTIREVQLGISLNMEPGQVCLNLVGIQGRDSDCPPYPEAGFNAERFKPIDVLTMEELDEIYEKLIKYAAV